MKKVSILFAFGLSFNSAIAQTSGVSQLNSVFDALLSPQFKGDGPGIAVLVTRKGQVIYQKALGKANLELGVPMQTENVFRIGSITKQFTAVAILQLMEKGKLNVTDEIVRFLPDYPTGGHKITIEHLLTHTSGIQDYTGIKDTIGRSRLDFTTREMIAYFKDAPLRFIPGTKYEYSNSNYFLLGYIIELISGKSYMEFLQQEFFDPLGMTRSLYASDIQVVKNRVDAYALGKNGYEKVIHESVTQPYAAGSIMSTIGDLFKWHKAILSYQLIKKETLEKALTRYKLANGQEIDYGYGWRLGSVYESPSIWHGGLIDGFMSMAIYLPREDVFVTVLSNCVCNPPEIIALKLAAFATGIPTAYMEKVLPATLLSEYAGVFENKKGDLRVITVSEGKVYSQIGRSPRLILRAFEKDKFYFEDQSTIMHFSRNGDGHIEKFVVSSIRGSNVWNRLDKSPLSFTGKDVDETVLESYVGKYEVTPEFSFSVTRDHRRLFLQADGQEKFELFAETESKFFLKVNDAELEFIKDRSGKILHAIMKQAGRKAEAIKIN